MNEKIKKIFDKHKETYSCNYCDNHETALNSASIDDFVSDIVKAITEAVEEEYNYEPGSDFNYGLDTALEIIRSFAQDKKED